MGSVRATCLDSMQGARARGPSRGVRSHPQPPAAVLAAGQARSWRSRARKRERGSGTGGPPDAAMLRRRYSPARRSTGRPTPAGAVGGRDRRDVLLDVAVTACARCSAPPGPRAPSGSWRLGLRVCHGIGFRLPGRRQGHSHSGRVARVTARVTGYCSCAAPGPGRANQPIVIQEASWYFEQILLPPSRPTAGRVRCRKPRSPPSRRRYGVVRSSPSWHARCAKPGCSTVDVATTSA